MTKVCQEAFIRKEPCINGKRNVKITNYVRENGKCRPFRSKTNLYCDSEKKQFCKCNVVDNIHYRTYDGQSIHFSGGCRYTLTRYNGTSDSCSFNIEIQNEHGYGNKHLAHTKSVIIHMFGEKFELGQHKTLKIGNYQRLIPYEQGEDVRIFYSNNVVQFVAPKCSVHVAFDQQSNAFIEVSKIYSKKMNGICGSCNEIQDDLKTKSGKDVSKKKDKYSRIANSYKVTVPGKYCKTAEHISYKNLCRKNFIKKANARNLCKAIISRDSPFRKCGQQAHVDLKNFYEDCLIDLCTNKNRRQHPQRVQCKILGILSEVCAESGIPGIKWRTHFNCPKKCGKNEHFTLKASPCPRTCENHFFGTRSPCYDLPEREGCECNKGYIRDGALCVKPMHCNCINLCVDRKDSENCRKWKARGDCEKFQEPMNIMCRKTCNFCKQRAQSCENEISTKQCLLFRRQGLCFNEFYRSICGLTCNYDKCKCEDDKSIVEKCNANYIKTTTHYSFARNSNGRCVKIVKQTHELCCPKTYWTDYGHCNFCTGKQNITTYSYHGVNMKCVPRSHTQYKNCQKCEENVREKRDCISNKYLQTTVYFNRMNGCFQCVSDQRISTTEIICKTTKVVKIINETTKCTTIYKRTPSNCQCRTYITEKCCRFRCPSSESTTYCENGKFIHRTLSYKLVGCNCVNQYSYRSEIPKCLSKSPESGRCLETKKGFKATETQYTAHVNAYCKCVRKTLKHERTCDCRKPYKYKTCNRNTGMLTTVYVYYQKLWRRKYLKCVKKTFVNSVLINFPTQFIKRRGVCKSNNIRTNKIYRKFRDGCVIRTLFYKYEEEICRCREILTKTTSCESGREILREFKLEFQDVVKPYCLKKLMSEKEFPIICPNEQINETKCINRRKTVTKISYYKHNCKCIKIIDSQSKNCTCTRRVISEKSLGCNNKTGIEIYVTVSFNERCNYETLVCRYVCICKPPVIETRHCSPVTGIITTTIERFYVVKKKSKCFSNIVSTERKPNCNNVKIIKQKCGQERNNYKKITTISQILSRETCSCKTITTSIWKCCKLPNQIITKSCRGNYFFIKVVNYKFDNRKINCIPQISYRIKRIQCPSIKDTFQIKKLPNCKYKQTRFYYEIENCKCKLRENSEIYYYRCCKQKPQTVNCVHNTKLVTTSTTFQLSNDRKQCRKYVRKSTQNITCRKLEKSRIKKISHCEIHIITDYYRVRNCKCEKYNTKVVKNRFCCKEPETSASCLENKIWRVTTTRYTTKNFEICIKQISFVNNIKKCPTPYAVVCPCLENFKLKSIIRHFYVTVNCTCVHRVILIPCLCHKIPNKIEIGSCTPGNTQTVNVFNSVNVKKGCKWKLLKSYQDACKCKKPSIIKTCLKNSIYRTTTLTYKLATIPDRFPKHTCVESKLLLDRIIECNKNYISYGKCIHNRKSLIECVYRSVNCKCEMSCKPIRYIPCDCHKLNKCKTTCIKNIKNYICYKYKSGRSRCTLYIKTYIPIVEKCPSKINIQCRKSNYPINNCYYKSCQKSFYVYRNCRCVKHTETINTCVQCLKPKRQIRCSHNRRIVKITNFVIKHNRCHPFQHEEVIIIECPRWKVIKTEKHGYTHYKLTYNKIKNCKCIPKICQGPNFRKTCPISKLKRKCSRNNQLVYTKVIRQIHFTNRRFCPEAGSPFPEQICIENRRTRIEPIKCPNNYEIITCIVSRNIKKIKKYYYKIVNCKCVKAVIIGKTRPCKDCRKPIIIHESSCGPLNADGIGYVQITTKYWKITRKNICKSHIKKSKRICKCRERRIVNECVNGKKIFKTIIYEVVFQCKPIISIISESIPCYNNGKPNKWLFERIHNCRRPGEFTIKYFVRMKFIPKTCGCRRVRRSVQIGICCEPVCRYRTVCRHNNKIVTISDCQRSEKLKCVNYKRETSSSLICPKPVKRVIGDCKGRVIRYRIISYKSVKCRCVKFLKEYIQNKISDVTKCITEMWRTTHIGYELYGHRCVPKRPQITFKPVYCSKFETFKDQRINECDFSRIYFRKFVSNCRCVDRFVRKEILHYRCCQEPIVYKRCVNHNTRVVITTNFKLVNFKCYPVRRESRIPVDCSHVKFQKRNKTSLCTYNKEYYYGASKDCKCVSVKTFTRFNLHDCCDHLLSHKKQECDKERGRLINILYTYDLVGRKCPQKRSITYTPINCDGRICEKRYSECIQNTQTVKLFCLKRQGCQCVKQIFNRRNVCCGRKKGSIWTETGRCNKNQVNHQPIIMRRQGYYKLITTFTLQLNYRTRQCTPVGIKQQYKICRCDESFVEKSCFKNIYKIKKIFSYKMDESKNICHERIDESISLVSECYKKLEITLNERETTPDGWCIRTSKIIYPVKCKCLIKIVENRFPCPCYKPVHEVIKRYCINNIIIVEKHIPRCRLNNIYWRIDKTSIPILDCSRLEIAYSSSYRSFWRRDIIQNESEAECCTRYMYETLYQWYLDNCVCKAKIIKLRLVCIACKLPHQKEECLGSNINVISYSYSILNGICRRTVNRKLIHIPCPTQPEIHKSKCINNKYTITTTHYYYDNCRCKRRVEEKTCHCKCGKDSKEIKCSRNYFLNEITTRYYKRDCRCFKTVNDKQIEPICPRFIHLSVGKCEIQKHHSIYRKITTRGLIKDYRNCKCKIVSNSIDEVCDCKKQIRKHNVCIYNNNFVIQTWGWRFNENKKRCDEVIKHVDSKLISCPPPRKDQVCNYNIGRGEETTTKYKLVNCKCIDDRIVRRIDCKCNTSLVLEHHGECRNNIRIKVYTRKEARGKRCVTVKERKYEKCCPRSEKFIKFCNYYQFVHYRTSINEFCQRRNIVTYIPVRCSQKITKRETACYRFGFKFIWFYGQTVQNCRCIQRAIRLRFCRCRCPGSRIFKRCHWSGRAIINIHISYKHVGCSCIFKITRNIQPIQCPLSNVIVSRCNESQCKGHWFRTTTVTNYHIRHCICVSTVTKIKYICKIKTIKKVSVTCDIMKKLEIRIESELIFQNGKCVNITKESRIPITCNNKWAIANNPICHLDGTETRIYQKLSFKDCRCNTKRKVKRCDCRCKSPFTLKTCDGNIIRKYFYKYEIKRCRCKRILIREETESIHCKSKLLNVGSCFEKNNRCVRNEEYEESVLVNCRCIKRRRNIEKICHSCCSRPSSTSRHCNELSNKFITTVTTCQVNPFGRIERISQVTSQDIYCEVGIICVSKNNCDRSTFIEILKCTTKTIKNCVCISKTETIKRDSCVCGLPKFKTGACDLKTCIQPVYQIERKLVILKNNEKTCDEVENKLRDETCCCLNKSSTTSKCINNRFIEKIEKYTFIKEKKTCQSEIIQNDITRTCEPAIEKFPGTCDQKTGKLKIKIITKRLVDCECKITEHIETEVCYCLGNRVETKCVAGVLETISYKYTPNIEKNQCIESVDRNSKKVECPMPDTESVKFDVNSGEQCKKTEYKVENCQCVPLVTPVLCSCPETCPKDTVAESCIPDKGVIRIVSKKHNFEKEGCKCTATIKTEDKQINCVETPKKEISKTKIPYENGDYYTVTTTFERRENCECVKQSSYKYVLVNCADKYNKTKSQNELYDFKCEKIPEPPKPNITCPENSTNSLGNGKNEVTYYVIQNEKCVKQTTVTKCDECKIQYCVEDSNTCDRSKCSEEAVRATCPITCGICETCTGNESKCETNPFDGKQYRKKG